MEIKDNRPDPTGPASPVTPVRDDGRRTPDRAPERRAARGDDRIEISDEGRAMASGEVEQLPPGTLAGDRLMDVRRRVQARYYDAPEVAEQVARRIIERGDL